MSEAIQAIFANALLNSDQPVPDGLTSGTVAQTERRFAVYRNTIASGLTRVLAARFPVTERLVGTEFFAGLAQAFIRQAPPRSPLLMDYGDGLAEFAADWEPAATLAYLPDVIRLEAARSLAYHAADEKPVEPDAFASLPPDRLPHLTVRLHSSASVVRSVFPVVTIWAMHRDDGGVHPIEDWSPEEALIIRPGMEVQVYRLPPGGGMFIEALGSGASLGAAVEAAEAAEPTFDLEATLACVLNARLFTDLIL